MSDWKTAATIFGCVLGGIAILVGCSLSGGDMKSGGGDQEKRVASPGIGEGDLGVGDVGEEGKVVQQEGALNFNYEYAGMGAASLLLWLSASLLRTWIIERAATRRMEVLCNTFVKFLDRGRLVAPT